MAEPGMKLLSLSDIGCRCGNARRLKTFSFTVQRFFIAHVGNECGSKGTKILHVQSISAKLTRQAAFGKKRGSMKKLYTSVALSALLLGLTATAFAQVDTRESAKAAMRTPEAKEMDATYKGGARPMAQKLVDEALEKHPEVILLAIHGGAPKYNIIASNFGRFGKLGDEDDLRVIHTGKTNLEVSPKGNHFEAELQLHDKARHVVGAVGVVFNYKAGDDKKAMEKIAEQIRHEMEQRITSSKALMGPA